MIRISRWCAPLLVAVLTTISAGTAQAQGYVVVANAAGPSTLTRDDLAKAFSKKRPDLAPIDQDKSSRVRAAFSEAVLGKPAAAVVSYWQQQIFSGKDVPPPEKGSDAEVLAAVRANPKAVGYVSPGTPLGDGVKAVTVR